MVTVVGTESNGLLLATVTTESVVVGAFKLTAHLPDLLLVIAEGEQDSDLVCPLGAPLALSVKELETPFRAAVSRTL